MAATPVSVGKDISAYRKYGRVGYRENLLPVSSSLSIAKSPGAEFIRVSSSPAPPSGMRGRDEGVLAFSSFR
jgi:hypothetical protein